MICKITKGSGFRGLFEYLQHGPGGEEKDRGQVLATNLAGASPREWAAEIGAFRRLRPTFRKAVFHASLSLAPEDRNLSDAEFAELSRRFLNGMGFEESSFLIVRHHDTDHQHVHLVASRIDVHGKPVSDAGDHHRARALAQKLEADFGLRQLIASPNNHNNNNKGADMDSKRNANAAGPADEKEQSEAAAVCMGESGESLDAKRKRDYKRKLLEESYQQQISDLLAVELAYVRKSRHSLEISFRGGGKVFDDGDRVRAYGDDEASARRVVLLCKAKGWGAVRFQGSVAFLRAAMREALSAGLKVVPADDHQAEILEEVIREQAGQAVGMQCEPVLDIPPLAVLGLKSRLGNFRRDRDELQPAPTDSHRASRRKF